MTKRLTSPFENYLAKKDIYNKTNISLRKIQYITELGILPNDNEYIKNKISDYSIVNIRNYIEEKINTGTGKYRKYSKADLIIFLVIKQFILLNIPKETLKKLASLIMHACFYNKPQEENLISRIIHENDYPAGYKIFVSIFPENLERINVGEEIENNPKMYSTVIISAEKPNAVILKVGDLSIFEHDSSSSIFVIDIGKILKKTLE